MVSTSSVIQTVCVVGLATLVGGWGARAHAQQPGPAEPQAVEPQVPQRVVVRWKPGQAPVSRSPVLAARAMPFYGAAAPLLPVRLVRDHGEQQVYALNDVATESAARSVARALLNDPRVASADLDHWVQPQTQSNYENDALLQWHRADSAVGGVGATPPLWAQASGQGVTVAVVDTGVMPGPDLAGLQAGYDFVSTDAGSLDGDGWDADARPDNHTSMRSPCGYGWHGTLVASLLGARANGRGTIGVAPGVTVVPVRALSSCGGWASDTALAMAWAAGVPVPGAPPNPTPARVVNASFGRLGVCEPYEHAAVQQALARGALIVASAGNDGTDRVAVPGNCPGVLAVTASTHTRKRAVYANRGDQVAVAAPGGGMAFDHSGEGTAVYSSGVSQTLQAVDAIGAAGTSLSAPLVSGVLALMLQVRPFASVDELKTALRASARAFPADAGCEQGCGSGIVDAPAAVAAIAALSPADRSALLTSGSTASDQALDEISQRANADDATGGGAVSGWTAVGLAGVLTGALALRRSRLPRPRAASAASARR